MSAAVRCLAALALVLPASARQAPDPSVLPNIVLLVADDVGWNDVSWNGACVEMPNLERLVDEGVRLDRFYVSQICSPTRMALLTGRYPIRWGIQDHVIRDLDIEGLPRTEELLPELLAKAGYSASFVTGKWHLGHRLSKFHPINAGFGGFLGNYSGAVHYCSKASGDTFDWHDGFEVDLDHCRYHTDLVGDAAVAFIDDHVDQRPDEPFLLYVPFLAAHSPKEVPPEILDAHLQFAQGCPPESHPKRPLHLAQIHSMDRNIGKILDKLDEEALADRTIVWFLSDNGGDLDEGASNYPLRMEKASVYDGGIRVPAAVRYPNVLPAGTVVTELVSHVDVLPTLRGFVEQIAGPLPPPLNGIDGMDVSGRLDGNASGGPPEKYHLTKRVAPLTFSLIRQSPTGLRKLVWRAPAPTQTECAGQQVLLTDPRIEIYDLLADPGESNPDAPASQGDLDELIARLCAFIALEPTVPAPTMTVVCGAEDLYRFRDQPAPCGEKLIVYREQPSDDHQRFAILDGGVLHPFNRTTNPPDGKSGLILHGIGRSPRDGLLYGITANGKELYQVDGSEFALPPLTCKDFALVDPPAIDPTGLVIRLGAVDNISGAQITAGDVAPDGKAYYCFDSLGDVLYSVELGNLQAAPVLVIPVDVLVPDLAFDSSGRILAYDEISDFVFAIENVGTAPSVVVLSGPHPLGSTGALWVEQDASGQDELFILKRTASGSLPIGIYRIDLVTGAMSHVASAPAMTTVDGAAGACPPADLVPDDPCVGIPSDCE